MKTTTHAHDDEDGRLDERERGGERRGHVFLKKLGHRVEHLRQSAGLLADGDHLRGQTGKDAGSGERFGEALAFAYGGDRRLDGLGDAARRDGARSGFKRRHQRQAAGEQRGERAREERHLVLEPDFAEDRQPDADAVDKIPAALR